MFLSVPLRLLLECFASCQKSPQWFKLEKFIITCFPDLIMFGAETLQGPRDTQRDMAFMWLQKERYYLPPDVVIFGLCHTAWLFQTSCNAYQKFLGEKRRQESRVRWESNKGRVYGKVKGRGVNKSNRKLVFEQAWSCLGYQFYLLASWPQPSLPSDCSGNWGTEQHQASRVCLLVVFLWRGGSWDMFQWVRQSAGNSAKGLCTGTRSGSGLVHAWHLYCRKQQVVGCDRSGDPCSWPQGLSGCWKGQPRRPWSQDSAYSQFIPA